MRTYIPLMPYIGISGFTSWEQVDSVLAGVDFTGYPGHCVMVGILASDKTINGISNKYPKRYPAVDQIASIHHTACFNVLHYHTQDRHADLVEVARRCGTLDGMQLNITWPHPTRVRQLAETGIKVILQLGPAVLEECDTNYLIERVAEYGDYIHYLLFDCSGGKNTPLDATGTLELLTSFHHEFPNLLPVIAGGLGPNHLHALNTLLNDHPLAAVLRQRLSIDCESGCRDETDELSILGCQSYLKQAAALFQVVI